MDCGGVGGRTSGTGRALPFCWSGDYAGVAYLTRSDAFAAGVMISASHNPFQDNGIKVFATSGFKLPDAEEHLVEEEIFRVMPGVVPSGAESLDEDPGLDREYLEHLLASVKTPLTGMKLVLDCGNGAASHLAQTYFAARAPK